MLKNIWRGKNKMAFKIKTKKPSQKKFEEFYKDRFSRNYGRSFDEGYMNEWKGRFESPRKAWAYSDSETRKKLKKHFPETFKGVKISDNLYNKEWGNKFVSW